MSVGATVDQAQRWDGRPGTTGTVAVIGLGKIGLPLAARYASAGWDVIGVDVIPAVVEGVNSGRSHVAEEPDVADLVRSAHTEGRIRATGDHAAAAAAADVVVMIVPIMLTDASHPDYRHMDAATRAVGAGIRPGTTVIYETTLPVGDTRQRYRPMLEETSGLIQGAGPDGFHLAFSPERVFSGRILADLDAYPKLVGGVDDASTERAVAFYRSVLRADVWPLQRAEAAEFAKLVETTYRDVNIALANEFARYAERVGVDILEVIRGANSQPYSHVHQPGIGVGGHCIPVYPHFLLSRTPDMTLVETSRRINDGQVGHAIDAIEARLGGLDGVSVLVLGLTYRENVLELAYSRALPLIGGLQARGAVVWAHDPLMDDAMVERAGARPYRWGDTSQARVIITQTADRRWTELEPRWFPRLDVVYDGRNSLRALRLPERTAYLGVGLGVGPGA